MDTFSPAGIPPQAAFAKRIFDIALSFFGLILFGWLILLGWMASTLNTRMNGFFLQDRVGLHGKLFKVIKIRTMRFLPGVQTTVTASDDPRITRVGKFLRKAKIDELPQLINVLLGQMSFVGPRPDVPGFADALVGEDRIILSIRPGITGPATLKYKNEEQLLASVAEPERYNREVIFPDKVRINKAYIADYSLSKDLYYIYKTLAG